MQNLGSCAAMPYVVRAVALQAEAAGCRCKEGSRCRGQSREAIIMVYLHERTGVYSTIHSLVALEQGADLV